MLVPPPPGGPLYPSISQAPRRRLAPLLVLAVGCTGADSGAVDTGPASAALTSLVALSADEVLANVTVSEAGELACGGATRAVPAGTSDLYLAGVPPGATATCVVTAGDAEATADVVMPGLAAAGLVLFDNAHGEQSGNADWVIDDNAPSPSPSSPSGAEDWKGAYSSFGYDTWRNGYTVRTNTGDLDAHALADVQVLVLPEPNQRLDEGELGAVAAFVQRGGGLVLIIDHHESDRDGDGVDSTHVADDLYEALGVGTRVAPESADVGTEYNSTSSAGDPADPVLHGRNGDVSKVDFYDAAAFALAGFPGDRPVLWLGPNAGDDNAGARVVASYAGSGRVLGIADSAPADDGTGAADEALYASWEEADGAALYLGAVDWAAGVR